MPSCVSVFILPPSREELERRLRDRKTDSAEVIERRLRDAIGDMSQAPDFDYVIINDDLAMAVDQLEAVFRGGGEECRSDSPAQREKLDAILA